MNIHAETSMDRSPQWSMARGALGRQIALSTILGVALLVDGAAQLYLGAGEWYSVAVLGGGCVMCLLPQLVLILTVRRLARIPAGTWTYDVTPELLSITTPQGTTTIQWDTVRKVTEKRNLWIVTLPQGGGVPIPKQPWAPEQVSDLRDFLAGRKLVKA